MPLASGVGIDLGELVAVQESEGWRANGVAAVLRVRRGVVRRTSNPVWLGCESPTVSTSPECSDEGIRIYNRAFDRNGIHTDMATNVGAGLDSAPDPMEGGARMAVLLDSEAGDDVRRLGLYDGDIYVYSPTAATRAFVAFTQDYVRDFFAGRDPESAQHEMDVQDYAALLAELKPAFIHHEESKRLIRQVLRDFGCDPDETYFDVPRLRTSTSDGYLTTGIAFAFHPHRDTWYSAPMCQINWWMPVFPMDANNGMAFHPRYFRESVPNSSSGYDYQRWNAESRFNASQHVGVDTREQPKALGAVEMIPDVRVVLPVGGIMLFSGAQLHSSVENTSGRTRFSIDFRTVNRSDAIGLVGAENVDSLCTGTTMGDYLRVTDLEHLDDDIIATYLPRHPQPLLPAQQN